MTTSAALPDPDPGLAHLSSCCPPADEPAEALAKIFTALGDPARVKIMAMLLDAEEVCACDISAGIRRSAATASHHLKILRESGLVVGERRGTWVYYRAVPERLAAVAGALAPTT